MNAALIIRKTGNSPQGNQLIGKFDKTDFPDFVTVKGTSDTQDIRGKSGIWISSDNYMDTGVTLILQKAGQPDKECCYNPTTGANIPCQADVRIADFSVTASTGSVTIIWKSVSENGLTVYFIDKKQGVDDYTIFDSRDKKGAGIIYSVPDFPGVGAGILSYQLRAILDDGNEKKLGEGTVTL